MYDMTILTKLLTFLTLFSQILIIGGVFLWIGKTFSNNDSINKIYTKVTAFIKENILYLAFTVSLVAVASSLIYSELGSFEPCKYCWFQRIFWYPLPVIFSVGIWKNDHSANRYAFPLALIGGIIAIYHYVVQMINTYAGVDVSITPCSLVGMTPSCSQYFFLEFGYITIPMMSVTGFLLLLSGLLVYKSK